MNTFTKYFTVSLMASVLIGCNGLDTEPQGDTITSDQKESVYKNNPDMFEAGVNAIAAQLNAYMSITDSRHNDFGYPAVMLMMDQTGFDMVADDNGYNWQGYNLNYEDRIYTSNEAKIIWNQLYNQIFCANSLLSSVTLPVEDDASRYYLAQGLAFRAFSYWVLAQLYQFNYVGHENSPCVPIITEKNKDAAAADGIARNTVKEVYDFIFSDLDSAISCLSNTIYKPTDKRQVDLATAYGLRARAHLTAGEWEMAAEDAKNAIDNSSSIPYTILELKSGPAFWDSNDAAIMWAVVVAETDDVAQSGIVNWPSHLGTLNYGYAWYSGGKRINKNLFDSISESDVRRGWWLDADGLSENLSEEQQKYVTEDVGASPYTNVKIGPYKDELGQSINANDIPLMRIEEMYLIEAEALFRAGDEAQARTVLGAFVTAFRDPQYTVSKYADFAEEIYRQRRIELWGEGLSWFDIMRLGKNMDRRGAGFQASMVFNIPAGDDVLLYRIPQGEIQANKKITEADNNPAAPLPEPVAE